MRCAVLFAFTADCSGWVSHDPLSVMQSLQCPKARKEEKKTHTKLVQQFAGDKLMEAGEDEPPMLMLQPRVRQQCTRHAAASLARR